MMAFVTLLCTLLYIMCTMATPLNDPIESELQSLQPRTPSWFRVKTRKAPEWKYDKETIPKGSKAEKDLTAAAAELITLATRGVQLTNYENVYEKYIPLPPLPVEQEVDDNGGQGASNQKRNTPDIHQYALRSEALSKRVLGIPPSWDPKLPPVKWDKITITFNKDERMSPHRRYVETQNSEDGRCTITVYEGGRTGFFLLSEIEKKKEIKQYHSINKNQMIGYPTDDMESLPGLLFYGLL